MTISIIWNDESLKKSNTTIYIQNKKFNIYIDFCGSNNLFDLIVFQNGKLLKNLSISFFTLKDAKEYITDYLADL